MRAWDGCRLLVGKLKKLTVILGLVLVMLLVPVACAAPPAPMPAPAPSSPEIILPPPPEETSTPETSPAPTPTPTPAPIQTPAPPPSPRYTNPQETISTNVGRWLTIGLHVTKRLGASWQVSYDSEMLTLKNEMYIDDNPESPGLGGTQYFWFEAVKSGTTEIEFSLKHGTTGPVREQKVFKVDIK